jgi:hypothetical protein
MTSKVIRNLISKMIAGRSDDGIMITLSDPKKVDFQAAMMEDLLMRNGIDPRAITNETQLKNIINQIKAAEAQRIRNIDVSGIRTIEPGKVFDMEGKQIPRGSDIMGGKAVPGTSDRERVRNEMKKKYGFTDERLDEIENTPVDEKMADDLLREDDERIIKERLEKQNKDSVQKILDRKNREDVYGLEDYDTKNMSDIQKEIIRTETKLGNLNPNTPGFRDRAKPLIDRIESLKNKMREDKAMGGRIGYKLGAGKKGVQALLNLVKDKFGKKSITTADKAPIPPKSLERDMFKKAKERFNKTDSDIYEDNLKNLEDLGAPKLAERFRLKRKYPGITDDLLDKILIDDNMQRKAEVLATIDEVFKMMEKGKGTDEILDTMKNVTRTKQADGGIMRSAYAGGGMGRRGFLKMLAGLGAGIGAAKTGILKFAGKEPAKQVAKEVVKGTAGNYPPPYFFKLVEKIKFMGDDVTEKAATKDREIVKKYKDFEMTEDVATGDIVIKKRNEGVFYDQDGIISDEYIVYKPGQADELTKGKKPPSEYEEFTVRPDSDGKLTDAEDGLDSIDEILEEVGDPDSMTLKKASGGIARMLGE